MVQSILAFSFLILFWGRMFYPILVCCRERKNEREKNPPVVAVWIWQARKLVARFWVLYSSVIHFEFSLPVFPSSTKFKCDYRIIKMWSYFINQDYHPHYQLFHQYLHYRQNHHHSIFHTHQKQWSKSIFCIKIFIIFTSITTSMATSLLSASGSTSFRLLNNIKPNNITSNFNTSDALSIPFPQQPFSQNFTTLSTFNNLLTSNNLVASASASNFTTSAQSSPFSTPYDALQWSSKQAVASGPVFIGDSVLHSAFDASAKNFGNFSGNLTLPHW